MLEQIVLKSNLPEGETSPAESAGAEFAGSECTTSKLCQAKTHFFKRKKRSERILIRPGFRLTTKKSQADDAIY